MTKLALGLVAAIAATTTAAQAADMAYKAAPVAPIATYNWSGIYVGADVGYAWGASRGCGSSSDFLAIGPCYRYHADGVIGGGFVGGNYQINQLVLGVEADWQAANARGNSPNLMFGGPPGYTIATNINDYGSLRGRVGIALDRFMIFGTGGVAWGSWSTSYSIFGTTPPFYINNVNEHVGWTAGFGGEYAITNNVLLRAEYRYTDLGSSRFSAGTVINGVYSAPNAGDTGNRVTMSDVRLGVAYKF